MIGLLANNGLGQLAQLLGGVGSGRDDDENRLGRNCLGLVDIFDAGGRWRDVLEVEHAACELLHGYLETIGSQRLHDENLLEHGEAALGGEGFLALACAAPFAPCAFVV